MKNLLIVIGITLVLALLACATKEVVVQKEVESFSVDKLRNLTQPDRLTVKLDEFQVDCPPNLANQFTNIPISDSPIEIYYMKVRVETTSLWTSIVVSGLGSMTAQHVLKQGDEEINVQIQGLDIFEISRPEDGNSVGQNIILEIDAIVHKTSDDVVFHISKENSGTTVYTLLYDNGDNVEEIARFTNDKFDEGDNTKTFALDPYALPPPLTSMVTNPYSGPLFDAHAHLVGSKDIKHTYAKDDRLHINRERADEIFAALDDENIIGLIGFLPVIHEYFVNDDSFNRHYQEETLSVVNRPDNKIIPFLHPNSHIGIPPNEHGGKLVDFIVRNFEKNEIPFRGVGEIHTSYPQTDSYEDMRMTDPVMLDLYDYAAANDLVVMIHPELTDMEDVHKALNHNSDTTFLLHGIINSGDGGQPITGVLGSLFERHQNVYFSVDAALMLGYSLMDSCMYDKEQFLANLQSEPSYHTMLASSVAFWKPVIDAYPERMMWGTDLYYWWHYDPDVIHEIARFGRDFITHLNPDVQERFAYRNAVKMLNITLD